jgi:hypothetical protein
VKTTMIKTIGLTSSSAICFGASVAALSGSGLVGRNGVSGFGGSDLSIANLSLAGAGHLVFTDERPMSAPVAAEAAAGLGFGYAAAGAGNHRAGAQQPDQQHSMWAFRGPGPWKERT